MLYIEFASSQSRKGASARARQAQNKRAIAAALRASLGTVLRKEDLAAAGTGAQWFIALLVARARRRKALIADADLGLAAERLRRAVERALDVRRDRVRKDASPLKEERAVRCGWTVLELDGQSPLCALRQAVRGAAVVARIEEQRAIVLAAVTHELRTPLTAIVGFAERLQGAQLDEAGRARSIEIIIDESRRLTQLAEGLIDIGAWTAGHLHLRRESFDVAPLIRKATESIADIARAKEISITLAGQGSVLADQNRCLQVFLNLLDNAVRHAPPKSIVRVNVRADQTTCTITIADRGTGFPPALRQALGRPFSRGFDGRVGLGLAISKVVIEAHGGKLAVAKGRPNRITVTLPTTG